jgi:hypothetical protein
MMVCAGMFLGIKVSDTTGSFVPAPVTNIPTGFSADLGEMYRLWPCTCHSTSELSINFGAANGVEMRFGNPALT